MARDSVCGALRVAARRRCTAFFHNLPPISHVKGTIADLHLQLIDTTEEEASKDFC